MDHERIEEMGLAERYVKGTLPPEEAALFEDHYLSCEECLDRIELAESMERGFKRAAAQDAAGLETLRSLALVAWLSRLGRWRQTAALLLAVGVCAGLPGLVSWRQGRALDAARTELEAERRTAAGQAQASADSGRLRDELERERQARTQAAAELAAERTPRANVPILFLAAERGEDSGQSEPTHRLHLPPAGGWVVFSLEVEPPARRSYEATLRDARGRELWRGAGLAPNDMDSLSLSLPGSLLAPGDFTLTVAAPGNRADPQLRFPFRVLAGS